MIWERLGQCWADEADYEEDDDYDDYGYDEDDDIVYADEDESFTDTGDKDDRAWITPARARTIECLNQAIALSPVLSPAYHALAGKYLDWKQEDSAASASAVVGASS